jgi:hypothetical protein
MSVVVLVISVMVACSKDDMYKWLHRIQLGW